jgi:formylglycine-generating enzyme required for sulfatase activity
LPEHPVVHVSWNDAAAFCSWVGGRLPTEAEWECAARGGLVGARFPWGDELTPAGEWRCNIWQGDFPFDNDEDDGFAGTSPVRSYPPNGFGLYDMSGNVWEWCQDWFGIDHLSLGARASSGRNPAGPARGDRRVTRGGSFLCHDSYCNRYRVAARSGSPPGSTAVNLGFRVARTPASTGRGGQ